MDELMGRRSFGFYQKASEGMDGMRNLHEHVTCSVYDLGLGFLNNATFLLTCISKSTSSIMHEQKVSMLDMSQYSDRG
jgi:hypothetical protein